MMHIKKIAVSEILLTNYAIKINTTDILTNAIIVSLFKKNKDKEFELLVHMMREYVMENNFFIYAIQSKYFEQLVRSAFDSNDVKCCAQLIIDSHIGGKSIFYDTEIENALLIMIKQFKSNKYIFEPIFKIGIYYYLPNVILCVMDAIDNFSTNFYHFALDNICIETISFDKFMHLYEILSPVRLYEGDRPMNILSNKIYYKIIHYISYSNIKQLSDEFHECQNEKDLFYIFEYLLNHHDRLNLYIHTVVYNMYMPSFMTSNQVKFFDLLIDRLQIILHDSGFDVQQYVIIAVKNILYYFKPNEYTQEYLYIIRRILDIIPSGHIYIDEDIWHSILKLGGKLAY